jgi:Protein of unknown function (DUF664)
MAATVTPWLTTSARGNRRWRAPIPSSWSAPWTGCARRSAGRADGLDAAGLTTRAGASAVAEDTPEELCDLWDGAIQRSRTRLAAALAAGDLDQPVHSGWPDGHNASLRRLLCDLIEEYGRRGEDLITNAWRYQAPRQLVEAFGKRS